jgi:5-methyltetrahydrofolate--homocysteine methyltransferase
MLALEDARANAQELGFDDLPVPNTLGVEADRATVADLRDWIDWGPFFQAWELRGSYPQILEDEAKGETARKLFQEANAMLDEIVEGDLLEPRGVWGLFSASRSGDDIDLEVGDGTATLHTLRQQTQKTPGKPNRALADVVAPAGDHVGAFVVTVHGAEALAAQARDDGDDYRAILIQSLADRLAEAYAEKLHAEVRREHWGYAPDEALGAEDLVRERYRGVRPAPGYPAQPDHTEKVTLFRVLEAERHTGAGLTEHLAMTPPSTVCGLYLAHPDAAYFNVGVVARDQVEDYAARKGMPIEDAERWLGPVLAYDPEPATVAA